MPETHGPVAWALGIQNTGSKNGALLCGVPPTYSTPQYSKDESNQQHISTELLLSKHMNLTKGSWQEEQKWVLKPGLMEAFKLMYSAWKWPNFCTYPQALVER